jgi:hypothetical protein
MYLVRHLSGNTMVAAIRACCPSRQMLAVAVAVSDSDLEGVLRRTPGEPTAAENPEENSNPGRIAATKRVSVNNKRFNFVKDTFNMIEYDKILPEYLGQFYPQRDPMCRDVVSTVAKRVSIVPFK